MANFQNLTIDDTGNLTVPNGTTDQRPGAPTDGQIRYNSDEQAIEAYHASLGRFANESAKDENYYRSTNLKLYLDAGKRGSYSGTGTTVYDLSGNGNDGTWNGSVSWSRQNGGAFVFNQSARGYINVPSTSDFAFGTGDFTLECWTYVENFSSGGSYYHLLSFPSQSSLSLKAVNPGSDAGGAIYLYSPAGSTYNNINGWNLGQHTWTHVVISRIGGTMYAYLNGLPMRTTTAGGGNNYSQQACNIGDGVSVNEYADKKIALVRVYSGEGLTREQVKQNYMSSCERFGHGKYRIDIPYHGLISLFDFQNPTCYSGKTDYVNNIAPLYNTQLERSGRSGLDHNGTFLGTRMRYFGWETTEGYHGAAYAAGDGNLTINALQQFDYVSVAIWYRRNGNLGGSRDILFNKENDWEVSDEGGTLYMAHRSTNTGWFWDDTNGRSDQSYPNFHVHTYDGTNVRSFQNGYLSQSYGYPGNEYNQQPSTYTKFADRGGSFNWANSEVGNYTYYFIAVYDRPLEEWEMKKIYELGSSRFFDGPR